MPALIALIMPLISGLVTPFVKAWTDYKLQAIKSNEAGFEAAVAGDVATTKALVEAQTANNQLKAAAAGHLINRVIMWVVGLPCAIHFALVIVDTLAASKFAYGHPVLGVPSPPAPFDTHMWAIIESFFLIQSVQVGVGNVTKWLGSKKP